MDGAGIGRFAMTKSFRLPSDPATGKRRAAISTAGSLCPPAQISDLTAAKVREAAWIRRRVTIVLASAYIRWQGAEHVEQ